MWIVLFLFLGGLWFCFNLEWCLTLCHILTWVKLNLPFRPTQSFNSVSGFSIFINLQICKKSQWIGCVILPCMLQGEITQPILWLFFTYMYFKDTILLNAKVEFCNISYVAFELWRLLTICKIVEEGSFDSTHSPSLVFPILLLEWGMDGGKRHGHLHRRSHPLVAGLGENASEKILFKRYFSNKTLYLLMYH